MRINGFDFHEKADPPSSEALAAAWRPYVETCIEAFGASRCMFESNFPVDKGSYGYAPFWNACKILARGAGAAEKTDLFSATAARFYRLEILMMQTLKIGDVTITSIIERDGRGDNRRTCSRRMIADIGRRTWRSSIRWFTTPASEPDGHHLPDLRGAHAASHHPGGYLHRRGQGLSGADGFPQAALAGRVPARPG